MDNLDGIGGFGFWTSFFPKTFCTTVSRSHVNCGRLVLPYVLHCSGWLTFSLAVLHGSEGTAAAQAMKMAKVQRKREVCEGRMADREEGQQETKNKKVQRGSRSLSTSVYAEGSKSGSGGVVLDGGGHRPRLNQKISSSLIGGAVLYLPLPHSLQPCSYLETT
jgi:hypothetical protein